MPDRRGVAGMSDSGSFLPFLDKAAQYGELVTYVHEFGGWVRHAIFKFKIKTNIIK
jgi:hypothetical protein